MANTFLHDLIQTGDHYEGGPVMPGHHETPETPIMCLCCNKPNYMGQRECVCRHQERWYQDEKRQVVCGIHIQEKIKDGLFAV